MGIFRHFLSILYKSARTTSSLKIPSQGFADINKVYFPSPGPICTCMEICSKSIFYIWITCSTHHKNKIKPCLVCCINKSIDSTEIFCQLARLWALPTPKTILTIWSLYWGAVYTVDQEPWPRKLNHFHGQGSWPRLGEFTRHVCMYTRAWQGYLFKGYLIIHP